MWNLVSQPWSLTIFAGYRVPLNKPFGMEETLYRTTTSMGLAMRIALLVAMLGISALLIAPMAAFADELSDKFNEI